ncbi:amidase [Pseudomaricurvus alkylphenolicus]|uniref:amidase n=1 Tax=Pseudomaricurvus alkylphenolicus TaxID=1306991 RepID=UPI00197F1CF8|nr:amidase [Pseudomaricurvus alkylphenolicus]
MEIAFRSASELANLIRQKELGCEELLEIYLQRVSRHNPKLNAVVVLDQKRARKRAREADAALARGEIWGPLHGVPMTCKESFDVRELPTTRGNPDLRANIPAIDALAIQRLQNAGAIIFGKTNVPLNLVDIQSYNDIYGTTNNPWDVDRGAGGSSGGSAAALAAGLTGFEIGSDIGGSIRNPAHYCGVFGHKSTWGIIPPRGHAAPGLLAQSDLGVLGPMGRSANDLQLGIEVLAGPDEIQSQGYQLQLSKPGKSSLADLKVAVWNYDSRAPVTRSVRSAVDRVAHAISSAGGQVEPDARPDFDPQEQHDVFQTLMQAVSNAGLNDSQYEKLTDTVAGLEAGDHSARAKTLRNQAASFRDYARANERRTHFRWAWHEFFKSFDVLICPVVATSAFLHDHRRFGERSIEVDGVKQPYFQQLFWPGMAVCSLLPATAMPVCQDENGLPIGVQIIGPEFGDLKTIQVARLLEESGFAFRQPPGYE